MKLYSDFAGRRTRQVTVDVLALASIAVWVWLGIGLYSLVMNLAAFGVQMQSAGAGFRKTMADIGTNLGGVPLIGGGIRIPFDDASDAGKSLEAAGQSQQDAVHTLALGLGIGLAAVPILVILSLWLIPRLGFARRAGSAQAILNGGVGIDLLALRALAGQRLADLIQIDSDPVGAWRRGDPAVMRRLAQLELQSSGVRLDL